MGGSLVGQVFNFLKNITTRLFNKHTPKGLSALTIALALQYLGADDDVIEIAMTYDWTFIQGALTLMQEYRYVLYATSVFLLMFGGFYVFRRNYDTIRIGNLEMEAKELAVKHNRYSMEVELKKLELELRGMQVKKYKDIKLLAELATEVEIERLRKELRLLKTGE